jgi:hypothetical protein
MGLFKKKPAGENKVEETGQAGSEGRDVKYEDLIRKSFGLEFRAGGWKFEGVLIRELAASLINPEMCVEVVTGMKGQFPFDQVCIVATSQNPLIVLNAKPPMALGTSLKIEAIPALVASMVGASAKPAVVDYHGTWAIPLK